MKKEDVSEFYHAPMEILEEVLDAMGLFYDEELEEVIELVKKSESVVATTALN